MNASRRFYPRLRSIILEVSNKMHSFRGAFCRFCREKRHADGFGAFNFATLVFLLLARHSPQAVSARAACVGCHQKYRESRDDVAGVLYLFSAKSTDRSLRLVLFAAFWSAVNRGLRPRGTLYFLAAKSTKNSPADACAYFVPSNAGSGCPPKRRVLGGCANIHKTGVLRLRF